MYIQEVSIKINSEFNKDELVDEFNLLLKFYRDNGQTQGKIEPEYISEGKMFEVPFTMEVDSLNKKHNNNYVNRQIEKIETLCNSKIAFKTLGKNYDNNTGPCECKNPRFYILFTNFLTILSPIICGSCDRAIPLYRLPMYEDDGYLPILSWESNYKACDTLQMNCEVGERWATNQMSAHNSQLSIQGREICKRIEVLTGKPTFYYLYNYRKLSVAKDRQRKCPSCGQDWLLKKRLHNFYDFKCDTCKLISTLTPNI